MDKALKGLADILVRKIVDNILSGSGDSGDQSGTIEGAGDDRAFSSPGWPEKKLELDRDFTNWIREQNLDALSFNRALIHKKRIRLR